MEFLTDKIIIVSRCLAGDECNYKGEASPNNKVIELVREGRALPLCPEILGGLPIPRNRTEIFKGRVVDEYRNDYTDQYQQGAQIVLRIAQLFDSDTAILKALSPSCGKGCIRDGSFTKKDIEGDGITTALLLENGIQVLSENEI